MEIEVTCPCGCKHTFTYEIEPEDYSSDRD